MNLMRFWISFDLRGQGGLAQLHARAGLVDQVDGLVRQEAVRDEAAGSEHRGLDSVVGVGHGVELLVALLDAPQDQHRIGLAGRGNLHRLEAALQRAVLFDRLAVFAGRGGADALDLAAGESGLENVGGVERALGRAGPHQRVQLIDEDDGVLVLHQLLHDGLQPLFELAAILRSGDDQREVQRQDALVGKERGHVALRDALGQAFDDGGLAHARLADQHGVVLGPAAQDLHHALEFVVAADQGIERAVQRGLRQVAAELGEQRALLGPAGGHLLGGGTGDLLAHRREAQTALVQDLRREALLFPEQAEQQVLGSDVLVVQALGFLRAIGQHALALMAERQVHGSRDLLADGGVPLDLLADRIDLRSRPQEAVCQSLVLAQQAEQQVLGLDVGAAELAGLVSREEDDPSGLFRVSFKHSLFRSVLLQHRRPANRTLPPPGPGRPLRGAAPGRSGGQTRDCG